MPTVTDHPRRLAAVLSVVVGVVGWAVGPTLHHALGGESPPADVVEERVQSGAEQDGDRLDRRVPAALSVAADTRGEPAMPADLHTAYERLVGAVSGDIDQDLPSVLELALPAAAEWRAHVVAVPAEDPTDGFPTQVHTLEDALERAAVCTRYGNRPACIEAERALVDVQRWVLDDGVTDDAEDPPLAPSLVGAASDDEDLHDDELVALTSARGVDIPGFVLDTWATAATDPASIVPLLVDDTHDQAVLTIVDALYSGTTGDPDDISHVNRLVTAIGAREAMVQAAVDCAARGDDTAHCEALPAWREHVRRSTTRAAP